MTTSNWFRLLLSTVTVLSLVSCSSYVLKPTDPRGPGSPPPGPPPPLYVEGLVVADAGFGRIMIFDPPFTTYESVSVILGPVGPHSIAANTVDPDGLAMDSEGNLFAADTGACRVLEFQAPLVSETNAGVVLGKSTFDGPAAYPFCETGGAAGMKNPGALAFDQQGNLWVADHDGGRVTEYVPPFSNGMAAAISIGHANLNDTSDCNGYNDEQLHAPTAGTLCNPSGIAFDQDGNMWVSDTDNYRVLKFVPPFRTGMAASLELGQPPLNGFTSVTFNGASASAMCYPTELAFDAHANLWVSDSYCNRVLEFMPPFTNGMKASLVLGQPDFTEERQHPPTANTINFPSGLSFDDHGNLYVTDHENNRVLRFEPPFATDMSASIVLGQQDMQSVPPPVAGVNQFSYPKGVMWFRKPWLGSSETSRHNGQP